MTPLKDPRKYLATYLTDKSLKFGIGQDTGLAELIIEAGYNQADAPDATQIYLPVRVLLTPEAAQKLLDDLPKLRDVLERAAKGPPMPDFVQ
jgi:hypothetical protein